MLKKIACILALSLGLVHPIKAQKDFKNGGDIFAKPATSEVCLLSAARMEEKYNIKNHLLETILSVESGIYNHNTNRFEAWPWSVNVNGKGYRYDSKEEAIAAVENFQAQGYKSIDVGCMQISLKFHGDSFASLQDAFDPDKNVEYAAQFLTKLYEKKGDWQKAAMAYHSKVLSHASSYKNRLLKRFEKIKIAFLDNSENTTLF